MCINCADCGGKSKWIYPVVQLADGQILRVCRHCYLEYYRPYFKKSVKREKARRLKNEWQRKEKEEKDEQRHSAELPSHL